MRPAALAAVAALAVAVGAGEARAQGARQQLDVTLSVAEAWDDDVLADLRPGSTPSTTRESGFYSGLSSNLGYRRRVGRGELTLATTSAIRYYRTDGQLRSVSHGANAGLSARLFGRTTIQASQSMAYSPSYLYGLFADGAAGGDVSGGVEMLPSAPDYTNRSTESYSYGTTVTVAQPIGRQAQLAIAATRTRTDYAGGVDGRSDQSQTGARVSYGRGLDRRTRFNVSYGYRLGEFGYGLGRTQEHDAGAGLSYVRPLSPSRSLSLSVNAGVSMLDAPLRQAASIEEQLRRRQQLRLSGAASVGYQFRLDWQATGSYRRGAEYVADLIEPVYVDAVSAGLSGRLPGRLNLGVSASYSEGRSAVSRAGSRFDTYAGSARVGREISRSLSIHGEYFYYVYDFGSGATLAPGVPAQLERHGVRAGLTFRMSPLGRGTL